MSISSQLPLFIECNSHQEWLHRSVTLTLRQESSPCGCEDLSVAQARWKKEAEELYTKCIHIKEELTKIQPLFNLEVELQNDHVSTSFANAMLLLVPLVHPRFHSTIGHGIYPLHSAFLIPIMSTV